MNDYAVVGADTGGKGEDAVGIGDVGVKLVGTATTNGIKERIVGVVIVELGVEVIVCVADAVDAEDLPEGIFFGTGDADDVVAGVVLPFGGEHLVE